MFLDFYGLQEQPFGVTPDPNYLYLSRTHGEALNALHDGIASDRGFMALIAEPGMGKTTVLYKLMEELSESARTVFLFQTQCGPREFFRYILSELGLKTARMGLVAMHNKLNEVLFNEMLAGRRFVIVIDEAQDLDEPVLETIRLLSDFETPHAKLLAIILSGQPQLAEKLARPSLSQLKQRVATVRNLEPLGQEETASYIEHRLKVAGRKGGGLFEPEAARLIHEHSRGIPREINTLCFNALRLGESRKNPTITRDLVQEVFLNTTIDSIAEQLRLARGFAPVTPAPAAGPEASPDPISVLAEEIRHAIQRRAYELYEMRGYEHGRDREDWLFAESETLFRVPVDMTESETELTVHALIPGFDLKDLLVQVSPLGLCLAGKRQDAAEQGDAETESRQRSRYIFCVLNLPSEVAASPVKMTASDGMLEVTLAKVGVAEQPRAAALAATA